MEIKVNFMFRNPVFPVLIIDRIELFAATNNRQLARTIVNCNVDEDEKYIKMIDSTGEEFWYDPGSSIIAPGFTIKRWTKKKIIDLYNERYSNPKVKITQKSLSNILLNDIISLICKLVSE